MSLKTLVDSSVWISHFKSPDSRLIQLLEADEVILHSLVFLELYLGKPKNKNFVFDRLSKLPSVETMTIDQFCSFIDKYKIARQGIGVVDSHLLGAAKFNKLKLYTLDRNLSKLADKLL